MNDDYKKKYFELKNRYESFINYEDLYKQLCNDIDVLKLKNIELKNTLDEKVIEIDNLKNEYMENTIVSSMNDMKKEYDHLEYMLNKQVTLNEYYINSLITLKHMINITLKIIYNELNEPENMFNLTLVNLRGKLEFIKEIIDTSVNITYISAKHDY